MSVEKKIRKRHILGQPHNKGVVVMPLVLDFGESHKVIEINKQTNLQAVLGYELEHPKMLIIKEALKKARKVLVYRLNDGAYGHVEIKQLSIIARYSGARGNDISIKIMPISKWNNWGQVSKSGVNEEGQVSKSEGVVVTLLEGEVVDVQFVNRFEELRENAYVRFEGEGKVVYTDELGVCLQGGEGSNASIKEWDKFFRIIRSYVWRVMAITMEEIKIKRKVIAFIKELREEEGKGVYGVVTKCEEVSDVGILSVANGLKLSDGRVLSRRECVAWVAGAVASAGIDYSEDLYAYEEAIDTDKKLNQTQIKKLVEGGHIVFIKRGKRMVVAEDINTFKVYTPKRGVIYRNNHFIRVIDIINQDLHKLMYFYYTRAIKQGQTRQEGKIYFREACIRYIEMLEKRKILFEVDSKKDIEVFLAEDTDGVDISLLLKISKMEEKTYVSILYNKLMDRKSGIEKIV